MENARELFQILTRRFGLLNKNCCSAGSVGISLVQSHILYEIDRQKSPSMQQVAETLGIDITTFSRQIQTLCKMNLVKKSNSNDDKRIYLLSLTVEGKFLVTAIDKQMKNYLDQVFSQMDENEKEIVMQSLKILNASMRKISACCS